MNPVVFGRFRVLRTHFILSGISLFTLMSVSVYGAVVTEYHTLVLPGGTAQYYITKPNGYNPANAYPMIVNFPGMGRDSGTTNSNQGRSYTRRFVFDTGAECTPESRVLATNHIGLALFYTGWLANYDTPTANATMSVIAQVRADMLIDSSRIFALGFSAGGYGLDDMIWGSYYNAGNFPFAGVIVCSCNGTTTSGSAPPTTMPVFSEYGQVASGEISSCRSETIQRNSNLQLAGYSDLEIHEIPGQGHAISDYSYGLDPHANKLIAAWWSRVNGQIGASGTAPTILSVGVSPTNQPGVGQTVTFTVTTGGGTPTARLWNFGDGVTTNGSPVAHAYSTIGAKTVTVVVSNTYGQASTNVAVTVLGTSEVTLPCIADTYVASNTSNSNYGVSTILLSNADKYHNPTNNDARDPLVRFDLTSLPAGANVASGVLRLYCSGDTTWTTRFCTIYIRGMLADWSESQATWNQRDIGVPWPANYFFPGSGLNWDVNECGSIVKTTNDYWLSTWRDIDITPLVREWAQGRTNQGLVIQMHSSIGALISSPKRVDFATREVSGFEPRLLVTYSAGEASNSVPSFEGMQLSGGSTCSMSWSAQTGKTYRLRYSESLINTNWISVGTVTAITDTVTIDDLTAGAATSRYYRASRMN